MATPKPDLTRIWANTAPPGNVVDPDITTPGKVASGWQAEVPPFEHFNFLQKWFTQGLAHNNEQGVNVWDALTTYPVGGIAKGSDNKLYKAVVEQLGNDPTSDSGANWVLLLNEVSSYADVRTNLTNGVYAENDILFITDRDKGGYFIVLSGGTDNGGTIITDGGALSANRIFSGSLEGSWFGMSPSETAANNSTAFDAAIAAATPTSGSTFFATEGGNNVAVDTGIFEIDREHVIPEWVNLRGAGKGLTVFKATAAAASIRFGTKAGAFGPAERGGLSNGFTVDGAGLSDVGLLIGFVVERDFEDIDVVNCKGGTQGDGIVIQAAQNCNFKNVGSQHNGGTSGQGSNIVIDYGAGNNRFWGSEINRPGEYNIKFIQSGISPVGAFSVPTGNRFYGAMIERWEDEDDSGVVTALGTIYHGAGRENYFDNPDLSLTGLPTELPIIVQRRDGAGASTLLTINNPKFHGTAGQSVALDIEGAADCWLTGVSFFENHKVVARIGDDSSVHVVGEIVDSSGGTFFENQIGGVKTKDQLFFFQAPDIVSRYRRSNAGDNALTVSVDGEVFSRIQVRPNGIVMGDGSSVADVTYSRDSAAGQASAKISGTGILELGSTGIIIVTGVPTIGVPDGFFAFRTDGGAGTSIYHRTGGAWVARA